MLARFRLGDKVFRIQEPEFTSQKDALRSSNSNEGIASILNSDS